MTDHEKLVQIASTVDAHCNDWQCRKSQCPIYKKCNKDIFYNTALIRDQQLRFAAAKKLTKEARDE